MVKYYIINGFPGSGKDTLINKLKQEISDIDIYNISSVDYIKETLITYFGISDFKTPEIRNLIALINKISKKALCENLLSITNINNGIVFIHIREPNVINIYKDILGTVNCKTILVSRLDHINTLNLSDSDNNILNYSYDFIIDNNSTIENAVAQLKNIIF